MTLGDIIKEYLEDHTVNEFLNDSGISKAYTYNLINNKGTNGAAPTPTIDTINKVALGVHSDFNTIFAKLDPDITVSTSNNSKIQPVAPKASVANTNNYHIVERIDGSVQIYPKESLKKYVKFITDPKYQKLIDAAMGCSDEQIQMITKMLNEFKKK